MRDLLCFCGVDSLLGRLQDGEMAGLDGLESVGLDCWEGFGTMSMGRI